MLQVPDALKQAVLRDDDKKTAVMTAARHGLEHARQRIWVARCMAVGETLGPWRAWTIQDHQATSR
jgi:hypothetical protein